MNETRFLVLTPVKPFTLGKSRLVDVSAPRRRSLAEAFARDALAAVVTCPVVAQVVVMTTEASLVTGATEYETRPDPVPGDLNASLVAAVRDASQHWPGLRPVVLCADLPALTPEVLADALVDAAARAPYGAAFVPDRAGTGTTLYTAPYEAFAPRFGPGSRAAHLADGAVEVRADVRLRQDVDEPGDLQHVATLGVGHHTAGLLAPA